MVDGGEIGVDRSAAPSEYDIPENDSPLLPFHKAQTYTIPNQMFDQINDGQVQTYLDLVLVCVREKEYEAAMAETGDKRADGRKPNSQKSKMLM